MHLLKFIKNNVTIEDRMRIGYFVTYQKHHGIVTYLAKKYNVSRPFIYRTAEVFQSFLTHYDAINAPKAKAEQAEKALKSVTRQIFSLRLDGKC